MAHPPLGQTTPVAEGAGLCRRRGGPVEAISPVVWGEHVTDEEYGAAPAS